MNRLRTLTAVVMITACAGTERQEDSSAGSPTLDSTTSSVPMINTIDRELGPAVAATGEMIVKFRVGIVTPMNEMERLQLEASPQRTSGGEYVFHVRNEQGALSAQATEERARSALQALRDRADVEYAQLNWILKPYTGSNDPHYSSQWQLRNNGMGPGKSAGGISLEDVWKTNTGNGTAVVSVLDTGIRPQHPQIQAGTNAVAGYDFVSDPGMGNDGDGRDGDPTDPGDACSATALNSWHGTHVAGIVGVGKSNAQLGMAGVVWNAKVQAVRVLGKCGGKTSDINDGIRWAVGLRVPNTPANPTPARILNLSLGGPISCTESPAMQAAINEAVNAGAVIVVAAGNSGADVSGYSPSGCNNVIAVAASDGRGHLTAYSNHGNGVTILAPGGDVNRDDDSNGIKDGIISMVEGGYAGYNGTSMAAPHVAGVVALWLSVDPSLTPLRIQTELQANALKRNAAQCPKACGAGLLNAIR